MIIKPTVFFDLETTGTDIAKDRIIEFAAIKKVGAMSYKMHYFINPGIPIPEEASNIHGITNEKVKDCPSFGQVAGDILKFMSDSHIGGFNIVTFDVPLLAEEFLRVGIDWSLEGVRIIDACTIFKKKEERTLSAAVQFYTGKTHEDAHSGIADVMATINVYESQLMRYPELSNMTIDEIHEFSSYNSNTIDPAGKIWKDPEGQPIYLIGKAKGTRVKDDPGFGIWMLGKDFPLTTKKVIRQILNQ